MRIIAGELGGRRIAAPRGAGTRPMLDRVREALFSSLGERPVDARVLDLFAGSGSLGLEALSRGAGAVRLVEGDRRAAGLLRGTLAELEVTERCELVVADALAPASWGTAELDLVFLDPPYRMVEQGPPRRRVLAAIERLFAECVAPGGLAVLHTPRDGLLQRDLPAGLEARSRRYGTNDLWFLERGPG
jgi:16S rRNA (guanine(966)-N(2))-methyltransferase RsmD